MYAFLNCLKASLYVWVPRGAPILSKVHLNQIKSTSTQGKSQGPIMALIHDWDLECSRLRIVIWCTKRIRYIAEKSSRHVIRQTAGR